MIEKHNIMQKINDYVIPIYRQNIGTNFDNFSQEDIDFLNTLPDKGMVLISGSTGSILKVSGWVGHRFSFDYFLNGQEVSIDDYFESLSDEEKIDWMFNLDELHTDNMVEVSKEITDQIYQQTKTKAKGSAFKRHIDNFY